MALYVGITFKSQSKQKQFCLDGLWTLAHKGEKLPWSIHHACTHVKTKTRYYNKLKDFFLHVLISPNKLSVIVLFSLRF